MAKAAVESLIIGGGAAGMTAAISAAEVGRSVLLLEAGSQLGRKILVSGNGRCNFTNVDADSLQHYHSGTRGFAAPALASLPLEATLAWFGALGVEVQQESRGRIFPRSGQGRSIVGVLADRMAQLGVEVMSDMRVTRLAVADGVVTVAVEGQQWVSPHVVLASGGPCASQLGADRSGIDLACGVGHTATALRPGLVPLVSPDPFVRQMHGTKIHARITVPCAEEGTRSDEGDLLFTRYGISGLVVLNTSATLVPLLASAPQQVDVGLLPGRSAEAISEMLARRWRQNPHRSLMDSFMGLLPDRIIGPFLERWDLPRGRTVRDISKAQRWKLARALHSWPITVTEPRSLDFAEVTVGGIHTEAVNSRTLESRLAPGLHLAGEMLDVHGDLGGYNLQWAWSSGWLAGRCAGKRR